MTSFSNVEYTQIFEFTKILKISFHHKSQSNSATKMDYEEASRKHYLDGLGTEEELVSENKLNANVKKICMEITVLSFKVSEKAVELRRELKSLGVIHSDTTYQEFVKKNQLCHLLKHFLACGLPKTVEQSVFGKEFGIADYDLFFKFKIDADLKKCIAGKRMGDKYEKQNETGVVWKSR